MFLAIRVNDSDQLPLVYRGATVPIEGFGEIGVSRPIKEIGDEVREVGRYGVISTRQLTDEAGSGQIGGVAAVVIDVVPNDRSSASPCRSFANTERAVS
jgi:hypothetical protein